MSADAKEHAEVARRLRAFPAFSNFSDDDLKRLVLEVFGDVKDGRARVEDNTLIGADQFGAGFTDGVLFRNLVSIARSESKFIALGRNEAGATVSTAEISDSFEGG